MINRNRGFSSLIPLIILGAVLVVSLGIYMSANMSEEDKDGEQQVPISVSQAYVLPIPSSWSYRAETRTANGGRFYDVYVYDEEDRIVMEIFSPMKEAPTGVDVPGERLRSLATVIGPMNVALLHPTNDMATPSTTDAGWAIYQWQGGEKFNTESFEIRVYFGSGLNSEIYQRVRPDEGQTVRFATLDEFKREQSVIESYITRIIRLSE